MEVFKMLSHTIPVSKADKILQMELLEGRKKIFPPLINTYIIENKSFQATVFS